MSDANAVPAATFIAMSALDYTIVGIYFATVLLIGWWIRRHVTGAKDFFESGRSLPAWICALGFLGANLGAQEVMGMAASGAKYGWITCHFYWIGAIPAMVFVGVFMMPFYYGSKARSVPEYLRMRFDEKTRGFNAITFAIMTVMSSGISMYALALLLETLLGWNFHVGILISGLIVLAYIFMGGLTSAIYNEVIQFFLIIFGAAPLVILGLWRIGGWDGMAERLKTVAIAHGYAPGAWTSSGSILVTSASNPMGVEWFGMAAGLGFVLSFGYWCTDFQVIQRALAAKDLSAARRTPLIAAIPKMFMPFLVILPGLIALALTMTTGTDFVLPKNPSGETDYNLVIPQMFAYFLPSGLLGLGMTALMASFMSGMAGNVTAFNTVFTYDLYQSYLIKNASDAHYLSVGRWATVGGILLSMATAYIAAHFNNLMDAAQLIAAFVNAPLFATFLLGMFWTRTTGHGAFAGLMLGTLAAAIHHGLTVPLGAMSPIKGGWLGSVQHTYASDMAQCFATAIVAWTVCFIATILISLATPRIKSDQELQGLVWSLTPRTIDAGSRWLSPGLLGTLLLLAALILNIIFW